MGDMDYLKDLDEKYSKYYLKDGDLVITKIGYPPKIMVTHSLEEKHFLASGNFYIITIDRQKADPYYIAAYLTSGKGRLALADISIGEVIPTISMTELKNMELPLPPMEEQQQTGQKYRDSLEEIKNLTDQLEKAKKQLNSIL